MKILITGSTGLLGQALVRHLAPAFDVIGLARHASPTIGNQRYLICDLTDAWATQLLVQKLKPDAVIHAQAMSDVDECELHPSLAESQNINTVEHLCHALRDRNPLLIALSSDYVFDGVKGSPYDELDEPRPLCVYGKTKLAGERVALRYPGGIVVRPSTLFGPARMNFCDTVVQRLSHGETVEAFVDQTTSPTYTEDLADGIGALMRWLSKRPLNGPSRIYHIANAGCCSRVEFARHVAAFLRLDQTLIRAVQMQSQHRPAPRPAYSALKSRFLAQVTGKVLRPWDEALRAYLGSTDLHRQDTPDEHR